MSFLSKAARNTRTASRVAAGLDGSSRIGRAAKNYGARRSAKIAASVAKHDWNGLNKTGQYVGRFKTTRAGQEVSKAISAAGRHKGMIAGGAAAGMYMNSRNNRRGRATNRISGRPTGPYMY